PHLRAVMNPTNFAQLNKIIPPSIVQQALDARHQREALVKTLLSQRSLPAAGWDDAAIELLLWEISTMDSNNFLAQVGVGEREGRIASTLVARRHWNLSHGIGRSGELQENQPKAAGSSLLALITTALALDALHLAGFQSLTKCIVIPVATGMSITL